MSNDSTGSGRAPEQRRRLLLAAAGLPLALIDQPRAESPPGEPVVCERLSAPASVLRRLGAAGDALRRQRYADAYSILAGLADAGDAPSALMALAMLRQGPVVFGSEWSASRGQITRWSALAAADLRRCAAGIAEHDRGE